MAIVGRTATVAENASATSVTGTLPTDRQDGDLCVALFALTCTVAQFTGPGGSWVQFVAPTDNGAGETIAGYYQFTPGSAPTATSSGAAGRVTAICQSYGGVDTNSPIDVAASITTGTATSINAPSVTTVTPDARMLSGAMADTSPVTRTWVTPSGMTMVAQPTVSGRSLGLAEEARPNAGATGTRSWTHTPSASVAMAAFSTALRPAGERRVLDFTDAAVRAATDARARRRPSSPAVMVRGARTSSTTDVAITSTFTITAAATRDTPGAATLPIAFSASVSASVATVAASTPITCRLEIEFTAGVWTDITSYVSYRSGPVTIRQGRPTEYDDIGAAVMTFALWNDDGRFMPGNAASPVYPDFAKGKRVRWLVDKAGATYTRFTGWIQAISPEFPGDSTSQAVVGVVATDGLGVLAQRRMRSNLTEVSLWRARADATWCDAWEVVGGSATQAAQPVNFSQDASPGSGGAFFLAGDTALSFTSTDDVSIGGTVSASTTQTSKIYVGLQATALQVKVHFKGPSSQVPTAGLYYPLASLLDSGASPLGHLALVQNGSANGLYLRNAANTANIGGIIANVPFDNWITITGYSDAGTPSQSSWFGVLSDGSSTGIGPVAFDVRSVREVQIPGDRTPSAPGAWGGIVALGTRTTVNSEESFTGRSQGALSSRLTEFAATVDGLPVSIATTGTLTTTVATGVWSGRSALEVLQEMLRTTSGAAWARPRDGVVYAVGADQLYPTAVTAAVDTDGDCIGTPRLVDGAEARPTRIDVAWPGGVAAAIDLAAEAADGIARSRRITTVAPTQAIALAAGQAVLDRADGGLRIAGVELDLMGAGADHAPAVLSEATTLGGLYPTARFRLAVPTSHFGVPTRDAHVQGWTETYGPAQASIRMDTTPAIPATVIPLNTFTAANGSGLPGSFDLIVSVNGTGTVEVQSNRARLTTAASVGSAVAVRCGQSAADVDALVSFTLTTGARAALQVRVSTSGSTLGTGYRIFADTSGTLQLQRDAVAVATWAQTLAVGTEYRARLRAVGKWVNAKVWAASAAEPGAWSAAYVDGTPLTDTRIVLAAFSDGTTATARSVDFDNLIATDGS